MPYLRAAMSLADILILVILSYLLSAQTCQLLDSIWECLNSDKK